MYVSSKGLRVLVTISFISNNFCISSERFYCLPCFKSRKSCEKHFYGISETPRNEMNNFSPVEQVTHKTQMFPLGVGDIS